MPPIKNKFKKYPYGFTDIERDNFKRKFSKLAGYHPISHIAVEMKITEQQVRDYSSRTGWSVSLKGVVK